MAAGASPSIDHVIVLMMENRSFDHIFGFRSGVNGLKGNEYNLLDPTKPEGPNNPHFQVNNGAPYAVTAGVDVGHSLDQVNTQLFGSKKAPAGGAPAMSGFVAAYNAELKSKHTHLITNTNLADPMQSFAASHLPALNALADAFCLCDNWHAEVPGPTHPNRMYLHAATSRGNARNVWSTRFDCPTLFDQVKDAGKTWTVYENDSYDEVRNFIKTSQNGAGFKQYSDFAADVAGGNLANYVFILPRQVADKTVKNPPNSMHAPEDVRFGEHFIADVYETIRGKKAIWESCVFVLLFDEHGGFYDHVQPGAAPPPDEYTSPLPGDPSWVPSFNFDRFGLRVPALIISPYVPKGVCSDMLQHTSVMQTVRELFGISGTLTNRDKKAKSFAKLLSLRQPRTDTPNTLPRTDLPKLPPVSDPANPANQALDTTQLEHVRAVHHVTLTSFPDSTPDYIPPTQGDASDFIAKRYKKHRGKPPAGTYPSTK
jgi:phospholipase C